MKKSLLLTLITLLLLTLTAQGCAESQRYSIQQLPNVTTSIWQQIYQAYGRTIEVNERITIPNVSTAPVLTVQKMPSIAEPLYGQLEAKYSEFRSTAWDTYLCINPPPSIWNESKGYVVGKVGQKSHALFEFDPSIAYADANVLTLKEAAETILGATQGAFPGMDMYLRNVALVDRYYLKSDNTPISDKGYYHLEFAQTFHGIPLMASIHSAFTEPWRGNEKMELAHYGIASASIYDTDSYSVAYWPYQELGTQYNDIPLLPFDAVKPQLETLIMNGYVRFVDSVSLGYVQFDEANGDGIVLVPAWVVRCEYHPNGPRSERNEELYTDANFDDNQYYRPLIFNAQTGEMIDPESTKSDRCVCPTIITW